MGTVLGNDRDSIVDVIGDKRLGEFVSTAKEFNRHMGWSGKELLAETAYNLEEREYISNEERLAIEDAIGYHIDDE